MSDKVEAVAKNDAACEDGVADAAKIKETFDKMGSEQAFELLKQEREKTKGLSTSEQDAWQKSMVQALNGDGKNTILPQLSIAYLNANKEELSSDGYISQSKIDQKAAKLNDYLGFESKIGQDLGIDDLEAALLKNAQKAISNESVKAANAAEDDEWFSHTRSSDEVVSVEKLTSALKEETETKKTEFSYGETRDLNKKIAESLASNQKLFRFLDESNGSNAQDGVITDEEVKNFLHHVEKNPDYKNLFKPEELTLVNDLKKTMENVDKNSASKSSLVKYDIEDNWFSPDEVHASISKDSIAKSIAGDGLVGAAAAAAALTAAGKALEAVKTKGDEEKVEEKKEDEVKTEKKEEVKDEKKEEVAKVEDEKVEDEKEEVVDAPEGEDENNPEKQPVVLTKEETLLKHAVQVAGEGPYQVAARLLGGQGDLNDQLALTEILKQQLIEDTGAKNYTEAVKKMAVGHPFVSANNIKNIRDKVLAANNDALCNLVSEEAPAPTEEKKAA